MSLGVQIAIIAGGMAALFFLSMLLTARVRRLALEQHIIDTPNERSSHTVPTPRGGGIAIVVAVLVGYIALFLLHAPWQWLATLYSSGLLVAWVGWRDDRNPLSPGVRLLFQFIAAGLLFVGFSPVPEVTFNPLVLPPGVVGVCVVFYAVWMLNLYNFMDGIDGIAGVQALTMSLGASVLLFVHGDPLLATAYLVIAPTCAGFLRWNWHPARIFMGDVGSTFLGMLFAGLLLWGEQRGSLPLPVGFILFGSFLVDATFTLFTRLARKKPPHIAHKSHAYQKANQAGRPHHAISLTYAMINLLWLLPMAWVALRFPQYELWILLLAWAPLILLAAVYKAGIDNPPAMNTG